MTTKAFLTLDVGGTPLGTLHLVLYDDSVPRTVRNFTTLLQKDYLRSTFHRIIRGFMAQGGDFELGDGTGGSSIYGKTFADENFIHDHYKRGVLSMANAGKDTNGSQFFITFRATPHLNGKHVVFGHVDLSKSADVLDELERVPTDSNDRPVVAITVVNCGVEEDESGAGKQIEDAPVDDKHAELKSAAEDLDDEAVPPSEVGVDYIEDPVDNIDEPEPKTKAEALKSRLRKLKMKMNQARQLNRREVQREGERLGSVEGMTKERRRQANEDKKVQQAEWEARNAKAIQASATSGIDSTDLVEQAGESVRKTERKLEKEELNRFSVKDYYNPEGQYRNYERNLKSLPHAHQQSDANNPASAETYNPMMLASSADQTKEREGARRLGKELKRRIEKQKNKRKVEFDETDVSYINQRNKHFNEKISRNFDKHTAEIRQNLERGTAL